MTIDSKAEGAPLPARANQIELAAAIGDANRDARKLLERLGEPDASEQRPTLVEVVAVLRRLIDAIGAVTDDLADAWTVSPLSEEQIAFVIQGGVSPKVFTDQGERDAEDWLVWSAIRSGAERARLNRLSDLPLDEVVPGLRAAVGAFPMDYTDLDRHVVLCAPRESLDGVSPIRWLLQGGDPGTVRELIEDLHRAP